MIDIAAIFKNKGMERESLLEYGFCKEGEIIEIMNLKDAPDEVAAHVETGKVYKAYHMNKKHWYTIILDESLTDGEIIEFIRRSFEIVKELLDVPQESKMKYKKYMQKMKKQEHVVKTEISPGR